eukprot:TRINITY_DN14867_c0_g1_i1.p1 TRINITY_DN14867_c0_g1~~TRINITY_DN14867_c0_g1_i1.p1  ORF type:complete len:257 (-),score=36.06 TRINITY_DN14867_c0_g1_i1:104-853(-)
MSDDEDYSAGPSSSTSSSNSSSSSSSTTTRKRKTVPDEEKTEKCDFPGCNKSYATKGSLTAHKKTHARQAVKDDFAQLEKEERERKAALRLHWTNLAKTNIPQLIKEIEAIDDEANVHRLVAKKKVIEENRKGEQEKASAVSDAVKLKPKILKALEKALQYTDPSLKDSPALLLVKLTCSKPTFEVLFPGKGNSFQAENFEEFKALVGVFPVKFLKFGGYLEPTWPVKIFHNHGEDMLGIRTTYKINRP